MALGADGLDGGLDRVPDGVRQESAQVQVPGLLAVSTPYAFHLPVALPAEELSVAEAAIDDCELSVDAIDASAGEPLTLALRCERLHLGELAVPLQIRSAAEEVEVALTLHLVPSDWHDLQRGQRELVTVDAAGLLDGAPVPAGAPVFLAADRLPAGALEQEPRLLAEEDGVVSDLPFERDGSGLWFALPGTARLWVYFAPVGATEPRLAQAPWGKFQGVWHLEDTAAATRNEGSGDLSGVATPTTGVVGGAASFDGAGSLVAPLDADPAAGALSAWVRLGLDEELPRRVAVGAGAADAAGAFDPEAASLYTDEDERVCSWSGSGEGQGGVQQVPGSSSGTLADEGWHHVALRWESGTRELLIDGVLRTTQSATPPGGFRYERLSVGSALGGGERWLGAVDEVRFASLALPASWFRVEHASVTGLTTDGGRPFVHGLRPDLVVQSATATRVAATLPALDVVPQLERGVLVGFVAALGAPATGAALGAVQLSPLAPAAEGAALSLAALSYEGALDGSLLQVTHAANAPDQVVVATLAFPGGTARGLAGIDLAAAPIVAATPQLTLAPAAASAGPAWILVAVASQQGVRSCDACGRHVVGPVSGGGGLVLDVFAGEREPEAHTLEPVTADGDEAAVVVVRVGP